MNCVQSPEMVMDNKGYNPKCQSQYPGYSSLVYVFTKQSAHAQFDKCTSAVVSGLESLPTMVTQFIESFNVGLNVIVHVFLCLHDSDTPVEFSCLTIITSTTSVAWRQIQHKIHAPSTFKTARDKKDLSSSSPLLSVVGSSPPPP